MIHDITARSLLQFHPEYLWEHLYGKIDLTFDDGVVLHTNSEEIIFSRYFWELHCVYNKLPLLHTHHIQPHLSDGLLASDAHRTLLTTMSNDMFNLVFKADAVPINIEKMLKLFYEIINALYNGLVVHIPEYVVSIDIVEFITIMDNPVIVSALATIEKEPTQENISAGFTTIADVIRNDPTLDNIGLAVSARNGITSMAQLLQCVGLRGYATELDSKQFSIPMVRGFAKGFGNIYNLAIESRSGARALHFADSALSDSEYFARRLQLLTMVVERIVFKDCGSTDYLLWPVKGPTVKKGITEYDGDLPLLVGKYYLDEKDNKLKVITKDSTELIDTTIRLRSGIRCKTKNLNEVCNVCFGELSRNVSRYTNIGYLCSSLLTVQITQSLLSTKHIDFSAVTSTLSLTANDKKYFKVSRDGTGFVLQNHWMRKDVTLLVAQKEVKGINNIFMTDDVTRLNPSRLSRISAVSLLISGDTGDYSVPIDIERDGCSGIFSLEFLQYIKTNNYTTDDNGNFVISLKQWKKIKPIITLPRMAYSYSMHGKKIAHMIEQTVNTLGDKKVRLTPDLVVSELFDLVNSKLHLNLAFLEIIIYAAASPDPVSGNYALSRGSPDPVLSSGDKTISNRSMSAGYAFEDVVSKLYSPRSFSNKNRPDHPFDVLIDPKKVLSSRQGRKR